MGIQHPQQARVVQRRRAARRLHQAVTARRVGGHHVHRDISFQDQVTSPPEAPVGALGEQVREQVTLGEDVARVQSDAHILTPFHRVVLQPS